MIAAWMLYTVIVSGLLYAAAAVADRLCAALRLPRRWTWLAATGLSVLLAAAALFGLAARNGNDASINAGSILPKEVAVSSGASAASASNASLSNALQAGYAIAARMDDTVVVLLWLATSVALIGIAAATILRLRRMRATWRAHRIADTPVLVSRDTGPALIGLHAPAIVLPAWLLLETEDRQRLIVQHEVEHLRARDHLALAASCVAACLLPWNAVLWWLLGRTRLAVEVDCDARVLRRGTAAAAYGTLLLDVTGRSRRTLAVPALADSRTHLERRLIAMTEPPRNTNRVRIAGAAAAVALMVAAACTADLPTASALEQMDVEEIEIRGDLIGLPMKISDRGLMYVVDGEPVGPEFARALAPEQISSIEVVKGSAALERYGERAANGVIYVTTRAGFERQAVLDRQAEVRGVLRRSPLAGADPELMIELESVDAAGRRLMVQARDIELAPGETPLMILDGQIVESSSLRKMTAQEIERIELLKAEAARRVTDDPRAANGVIRITSRKDGSR